MVFLSYRFIYLIFQSIFAIESLQKNFKGDLKREIEIKKNEIGILLDFINLMQKSLRDNTDYPNSSDESTKTARRISIRFFTIYSHSQRTESVSSQVTVLSDNVIQNNNALFTSRKQTNADIQSINGNINLDK